MAEKFDRIKYNNDFNRQTYDRIGLMIRRDSYPSAEDIKEHCAKTGESMNAFFTRAARELIEKDKKENKV